eukprot:2038027-Rhodomonas_salina.1
MPVPDIACRTRRQIAGATLALSLASASIWMRYCTTIVSSAPSTTPHPRSVPDIAYHVTVPHQFSTSLACFYSRTPAQYCKVGTVIRSPVPGIG